MTTLPWRGRCSSWYGALSHLKFVLNKSQVQRSRHQFHYTYMLQYQSHHHGGLSGRSSFQVAFSVLILFPPQSKGLGALRVGGRSLSLEACASLASAPSPSSFSINHFPDGSHPSAVASGSAETLGQKVSFSGNGSDAGRLGTRGLALLRFCFLIWKMGLITRTC